MPVSVWRKKPRRAAEPAAIRGFWAWWLQEGTGLVARGRDAGGADYAKRLSRHVSRISSGLAWELGPGTVSEHQLVIFSKSSDYAPVARRVLKAAPAPSPEWEYADVRQPAEFFEDLTLGLGGQEFDSTDFRVGLMLNRYSVDIAVHHPRLQDLPAAERMEPIQIMLDHAIGQRDVGAWIGVIEPVLHELPAGIPLGTLRSVIAQLHAKAFDADGQPSWHELNGTTADGLPILAWVQVPLVPAFWPEYDQHVALSLPYELPQQCPPELAGLPAPQAEAELKEAQDQLAEEIAGQGRLVATETTGGRRTLHFYVDSTGSAAWQLEAAAAAWPGGRAGCGTQLDPTWANVRHLRIK
ncbi:DUF695 domain-containing protein [Arthrobacter sp. I2-34]|uniref:DUF695 domain-containing protein n=1 Tax=Arthrobacter hankyongi TaxID=2904801 RepID=A0ABS9L1I0_9MICC|nr:DUF695 domain-containing protein [Arthrobacter hankyongi]MCG2620450.1 DUF695 domain-containing protein [Arthrobacter hankyongi]